MSAVLQTCLIGFRTNVLNVRKAVTPETDGRDVICTTRYVIVLNMGVIKKWGKILSSRKRARIVCYLH